MIFIFFWEKGVNYDVQCILNSFDLNIDVK